MATMMRARPDPVNNRTQEPLRPASGEHFTLEELQRLVGGYIEVITVGENKLVLNEDGKELKLPVNEAATRLCRLAGVLRPEDFVVGNAVLCTQEGGNLR